MFALTVNVCPDTLIEYTAVIVPAVTAFLDESGSWLRLVLTLPSLTAT